MSPRQVLVDLEGGPATLTQARHAAYDALHDWGFGACAAPVVSAVGELVAHALSHTPGALRLQIHHYGRHVLVEVFDTSPHPPSVFRGGPEGGWARGTPNLLNVAAHWGWSEINRPDWRGKRVWFTHKLPPAAGRPPARHPCMPHPRAASRTASAGDCIYRKPTARPPLVTMFVPSLAQWPFSRVFAVAARELQIAGVRWTAHCLSGGSPSCPDPLDLSRLRDCRADAVLVIGADVDCGLIRQELAAVPVTVVGATAPGCSSVRIDDCAGAQHAVNYLANLGHRRIALIGGSPAQSLHSTSPMRRRLGYRRALQAQGLPREATLEIQTDLSVAGGERAMADLLSRSTPPTAVFAAADEAAHGAMRVLRDSGMRTPEDMSIVGFDDHDVSDLVGLTTVVQPATEQGRIAARLLLTALNEPDRAAEDIVLATPLAIRATAGPPPLHRPG
ncbi:substrate-binding domain-containing protein [Streptomyces sp. NPDC055709]